MPEGAPRSAGDGGAEQRPADAGERVEHQLPGLAEELDQAGHQARRLVRPVRPSRGVPELRRVGRRQQRLGEVEPFLAGQLVERVGGVGSAPTVGHPGQPSPRRQSGRGSDGARPDRRMPYACQLHERALRGTRGGIRPPRPPTGRRRARRDPDDAARWDGGRRGHPLPRRGDRADARAARADDGPARDGLAVQRRRAVRPHRPCHRAGPARHPGRDPGRPPRAGDVRGHPAASRSRAAPGGDRRPGRRRRADRPGTSPGTDPRGRPRAARADGRTASGRARDRGPPPRRRRHPGADDVPGQDRARAAAGDHRDASAGRRRSRRPVDRRPRVDRRRAA